MTLMPADDAVYSYEIDIGPEERALGIVGGRFVAWKRAMVFIAETESGEVVFGLSSPKPGTPGDLEIGYAIARSNAFRQIVDRRARGLLAPLRPRPDAPKTLAETGASQ